MDVNPAMPEIVVGGNWRVERDEGSIVPAPMPPVCQDWKVPLKGSDVVLSDAHVPTARRGSVGIQPPSRPREYDQSGDSTMLVFDGAI